jgi:hypothetical protein
MKIAVAIGEEEQTVSIKVSIKFEIFGPVSVVVYRVVYLVLRGMFHWIWMEMARVGVLGTPCEGGAQGSRKRTRGHMIGLGPGFCITSKGGNYFY